MNQKEINNYIAQVYEKTKKRNYVKDSYFANYKIDESSWCEDIRFLDGTQFTGSVDLFVGGSPCQSFSLMGKRGGLEDTRGTLFYDYARLIKEIQPKAFIYENVPGMLTHDGGDTWKTINEVFKSLHYKIQPDILNALHFGIPQGRKRLYVVGWKDKEKMFEFPQGDGCKTTMFDYLEETVDSKYYLGKKGFEFVTNPQFSSRAKINSKIIKTQKANQQFNWNGDFVFESYEKIRNRDDVLKQAYVGKWNGQVGVARKLTPRECLRLMGYPDDFKIVVPDVQAYRQSGNSIVVPVMRAIVRQLREAKIL